MVEGDKSFQHRGRPYPRSSNYTFHPCTRTSIRTSDEISGRRRALEIGCMPAKWPSDRGKPVSRVCPPKAPLGGLTFSACYHNLEGGMVEVYWDPNRPLYRQRGCATERTGRPGCLHVTEFEKGLNAPLCSEAGVSRWPSCGYMDFHGPGLH
jgi:hypothetical protein